MNGRISPVVPPFTPDIAKMIDAPQRIESRERLMQGAPPLLLFTTLARNPRVFQRFMAGGLLDKGTITLREREIVIGRTTARCGSEYEWGVHVAIFSQAADLTSEQIAAMAKGPADDPAWTPRESLILRLADSLHDTCTLDAALWHELEAEFSPEQLLELIVLAGFYHTVSFLTNALALPPEKGAPRFPP
jgi:alkylhydroperoxidase family enzyme